MTLMLLTLLIEQARRHPALWDAETKLKNVCDWSKSWEHAYACQTRRSAGAPAEDIAQTIATRAALQRKLDRHAAAVAGMLPKREEGQSAEGWLAKLDEPVRRRLLAHRHYDGREITHLLQAVRTIHRFLRCAPNLMSSCA